MHYRRVGRSGLKLPAVSLGLWHNFGEDDSQQAASAMVCRAFDLGITHFDLANNYGPPPGSAEDTFGRILREHLALHRDELVISTKAGYTMWPGPYGDFGSRKYLIASLDQSLRRMGIDYVDIFYSHRFDPETPLEETMGALDHIVRSGKALYVGISNYGPHETEQAAAILQAMGTPCLIHQARYNMFHRWIEADLLRVLDEQGMGCIVFSPLDQGILTGKYLNNIPDGSRAAKAHGFLKEKDITASKLDKVAKLALLAKERGSSLTQLALAWTLRLPGISSVLIGASQLEQIDDCVGTLQNLPFTEEELSRIEQILAAP
jgi:L-glyceraldehyde 3-phosphate reductase